MHYMYICQCYFSIFEILSKDFIIVIDNFLFSFNFSNIVEFLYFFNKCFSYFSTN